MGHNRFEGMKFQDMTGLVGDRQLAFNLLMPELVKTKEPEEAMVFFFLIIDIVIVHEFLMYGWKDPLKSWETVGGTWPYLLIAGVFVLVQYLKRQRGLEKIRVLSGNPLGMGLWGTLCLIELTLALSVFHTSGFLHKMFLGLTLVFGLALPFAGWLTEKAYLIYDMNMDRQRWLISLIPDEKFKRFLLNDIPQGKVMYRHELNPVPPWADEEIDRLLEAAWRVERSKRIDNIYVSIFVFAFIFFVIQTIEFKQYNGVLLPLKTELIVLPHIIELLAIMYFVLSAFFVFVLKSSLQTIVVAFIFHIGFLVSEGVDSLLGFLIIGYLVIIWKGVENSFRLNKDKNLVSSYDIERPRHEIERARLSKIKDRIISIVLTLFTFLLILA